MIPRLPLLIRISLTVLVITVFIGLTEAKTTDDPNQTSTKTLSGFYTKKLSNGTIITVHDPKKTSTSHTPTKTPFLDEVGGFFNSLFGKATSTKKEESTKHVTKTGVTHHSGTTTKKDHSTTTHAHASKKSTTKHHSTTTSKKKNSGTSTKPHASKTKAVAKKTTTKTSKSTKKSSSKVTKTSHAKTTTTTTSVELVKTLTWINGTLTITRVSKPTPKPKKVLTISDGKLTWVTKPATTSTTKKSTTTKETETSTKKPKKSSTTTKVPEEKTTTTTTAEETTTTTSKPHKVLTIIDGTLTWAPKTTTTTTTTTTDKSKTAASKATETTTTTTTKTKTKTTDDSETTTTDDSETTTTTDASETTTTKDPIKTLSIINGTFTWVPKVTTTTISDTETTTVTATTTDDASETATVSENYTTILTTLTTTGTYSSTTFTADVNGTETATATDDSSDTTTTTTITETPADTTSTEEFTTTTTTTEEPTITTTTTSEESTTTTTTTEDSTTTTTTKESSTRFEATSTYRYKTYTWLTDNFTYNPKTKTTSTEEPSKTPDTTPKTITSTTTSADAGSTSSNSNNIPEYIAPNVDAIIPDTSSMVHMKFNTLSYAEMVQDAILTAQFVQSLPVMISKSLDISVDDVIVVTITSASNTQSRKRDDNSGILVNMAIPSNEVSDLQDLVSQTNSSLYSPSNGQLASFIDPSYTISNNAASQSSSDSQTVNDPNAASNNSNNSNTPGGGGLSKGALIGICVSVGVVVYAAATIGVVHVYRKRRQNKEQEAVQQHQIFTQSISSPIMNDNSLGWSNGGGFTGQTGGYMVQQPQYQQQQFGGGQYHASQW